MKTSSTKLAAAAVLWSLAGSLGAQTFVNAGFENPAIPGTSPGNILFNNSGNPMPGWSLPATPAADMFILTAAFNGHGNAYAGQQYASNISAVTPGSSANSILSQTVAGFTPGSTYQLTYAIADAYASDGLAAYLDVTVFDGVGKIAFSPDSFETTGVGYLQETLGGSSATTWQQRALAFTPTTSSVTFSFDFSVPAQSQVYSAAVDNVGLALVPEPSAALLGGFGFLAMLRRRRA